MVTRNPLAAFGAFLQAGTPGRLVGLDYGLARVGVAVSDSGRRLATVRGALAGRALTERVADLARIVEETGALGVVIGLPLNMDGTYGPSAQAAQSFGHEVEKQLNINVLLWDERLTSRQAEGAFFEQREGRQTRGSKKASVGKMDAAAAQVMLQSLLDSLSF